MASKKSTPACRYGLTVKGTRNRRHQCSERCEWTGTQALDHFRTTGYAGFSAPVQIIRTPCPCGQPYVAHWATATDHNGRLTGFKRANTCTIEHDWTPRHLLTCLCPDCETYKEDRRMAEAAATIRRTQKEVAA